MRKYLKNLFEIPRFARNDKYSLAEKLLSFRAKRGISETVQESERTTLTPNPLSHCVGEGAWNVVRTGRDLGSPLPRRGRGAGGEGKKALAHPSCTRKRTESSLNFLYSLSNNHRDSLSFYILTLSLCAFILTACQPAPSPPPRDAEQPPREESSVSLPDARYEIEQPTLEQQDEQGRILWKLKAQSLKAESQDAKAQGVLAQVQGWLYKDGKPVLEFRAPYARANADTREVEAWGRVQATSKTNDARLQAGRILWKSREDRIIAREGVFLKWGAFELHERALIVDTALEKVWGAP